VWGYRVVRVVRRPRRVRPQPPTARLAGLGPPDFCPFCGTHLADAGAGFVDHVAESPACAERFEAWRENVADDVGGDWGG
jgi:hypothetical protein